MNFGCYVSRKIVKKEGEKYKKKQVQKKNVPIERVNGILKK